MDLEPESDDQIYDIDDPTGIFSSQFVHTMEVYDSFVEFATFDGAKASDDLFWHYQVQVDDDLDAEHKPLNKDTVLNDVGSGTIVLPASCHFQPRK